MARLSRPKITSIGRPAPQASQRPANPPIWGPLHKTLSTFCRLTMEEVLDEIKRWWQASQAGDHLKSFRCVI
jgi:hypothetical protein